MAMFLIVGCQTIEAQLPEETKPEEENLVVNAEKSDEQQALETCLTHLQMLRIYQRTQW